MLDSGTPQAGHADGGRQTTPCSGIVIVGAMPPPVNGMSLVTERMSELLGGVARVEVINVTPGAIYDKRRVVGRLAKFGRYLFAWARLCGYRLRSFNVLYTPVDNHFGLYLNIITTLIGGRLLGYRIVLHHHTAQAVLYGRRPLRWLDRVMPADGIHIFTCRNLMERFRAGFASTRTLMQVSNATIIPSPPTEPGEGSVTPGAPGGRPLVLGHLSNLCLEKGLDTVLATFARLRDASGGVRLVIAGPCLGVEAEPLLRQAHSEFGDAVEYRGPVYGADKARFFSDIDLFVFPTRYELETEPLVVVEALQHGRPVLSREQGCIPDMVGSQGGLIVPAAADFAAAVEAYCRPLLADPQRLAEAKNAALRQAAARQQEGSASYRAMMAAVAGGGEWR